MKMTHRTDREIHAAPHTALCRCPTEPEGGGERAATPAACSTRAIDTERYPIILERVEAALNALAQRVSGLELLSESAFARLAQVRSEENAEIARQLVIDPLLVELCNVLLECRTPIDAPASDFELRLGAMLTRHGVSSFRPSVGDPFDPRRHSHGDRDFAMVSKRERAKHIAKVRAEGFQRGERVLVPARVVVTKYESSSRAA